MAIDRIEKTDPNLYRIQQAGDGGQKRQGQEQEKKDEFEKKPSVWRRILAMNSGSARPSTLLGGRPQRLPISRGSLPETEEEASLTLSERILVLWGVLGRDGRPRPGMILSYVLVLGMMIGATLLIIGMTLWR